MSMDTLLVTSVNVEMKPAQRAEATLAHLLDVAHVDAKRAERISLGF
jgi:hypothetical protein